MSTKLIVLSSKLLLVSTSLLPIFSQNLLLCTKIANLETCQKESHQAYTFQEANLGWPFTTPLKNALDTTINTSNGENNTNNGI